jgi:hypothetical protein
MKGLFLVMSALFAAPALAQQPAPTPNGGTTVVNNYIFITPAPTPEPNYVAPYMGGAYRDHSIIVGPPPQPYYHPYPQNGRGYVHQPLPQQEPPKCFNSRGQVFYCSRQFMQ